MTSLATLAVTPRRRCVIVASRLRLCLLKKWTNFIFLSTPAHLKFVRILNNWSTLLSLSANRIEALRRIEGAQFAPSVQLAPTRWRRANFDSINEVNNGLEWFSYSLTPTPRFLQAVTLD